MARKGTAAKKVVNIRPEVEKIPETKLLTTHEVAKLLQVDASTVSKWVDKDVLHGYRTPGGHRRVLAKDVRAMAEKSGMYLPPELEA